MSRELLKRALDALDEYFVTTDEGKSLLKEIEDYLSNPLAEPLGYVHHEMFAGFVKEPCDASMSCVKLLIPDSGYTVPVYAEPTARKALTEALLIERWQEHVSRTGEDEPLMAFIKGARFAEEKHGITNPEQSKPKSNAI